MNLCRKNYRLFIILPLVALSIALFVSALQKPMYESQTTLLVVQKQGSNIDAYTAAKASEKLGNNLAKVINTTSFLDKVSSQPNADLSFLPKDEKKRRKAWQEAVSASIEPETSLMKISAYAPSRESATNLAQAISYTLTNDSASYYGNSDNISIQVVNTALTSSYPIKPNYLLNMLASIACGILFAAGSLAIYEKIIYLLPKKKGAAAQQNAPMYKVLSYGNYPSYSHITRKNIEPKSMFDHLQ